MMKLKKTYTLFLSVVFLLLINSVKLHAQGVPCGDPDIDCPIDGAVVFLMLAILFLSIKKIAGRNQTPLQLK